jgi:hypothetical protein
MSKNGKVATRQNGGYLLAGADQPLSPSVADIAARADARSPIRRS